MSDAALTRWHNGRLLLASAAFGMALILFGILQSTPGEVLGGLWHIISHEDVLITDYIATAGIGAAFVNAGLVTLISVFILYLLNEPPNGSMIVTVGLMAGFSLFGKNIANIWPIMLGTGLYSLVKRESFSRYVHVALRATALSPMVSFMWFEQSLWAGTVIGLAIGFLIPPVSEYTFKVQNGMNLYAVGFACGVLAMMMVPAFKAFGLTPASAFFWSTGNNLLLGGALAVLCLVFIAAGLIMGGKQALDGYWALLHTSGRAPSDYFKVFGEAPVLINMGVNGLLGTGYILLIGGDLNGATIGGIFTIIGFSAYGKHAFNIVPVMGGVLLGSLLNHVQFNNSSLQLAGLFGTTLAPFSGFYGWPFGILAGLIHSSVVLQAGLPLEGMNLYNNGFSGGLVAIVLDPVLISLLRHRHPSLQDEDLFSAFYLNPSPPQDRAEYDIRKREQKSKKTR